MTSVKVPVISFEDTTFSSSDAVSGDVLVLTKPLGTFVGETAKSWCSHEQKKEERIKMIYSADELKDLFDFTQKVIDRSNFTALKLMKKYDIHAVTHVSDRGFLKDAEILAEAQKYPVDFFLYNFPLIARAQRVSLAFEDHAELQILKGLSPEIKGGLLIAMRRQEAISLRADILLEEGCESFIIGLVEDGNRTAKIAEKCIIIDVLPPTSETGKSDTLSK